MQNTESVTDKELFLQDFNAEDDSYTMTMDEVEQTLLYHSVGNGNVPHTPESTMMTLAGILQKEYAMRRVFSKDAANAHRLGNIHIHNADMPSRCYSMQYSEVVMINGELWPIGNLFDTQKQIEILEDRDLAVDIVGNRVQDIYGPVKISKFMRHENSKKMKFISLENGKTIICTEDHPFTLNDVEIPAKDLKTGDILETFKLNRENWMFKVNNINGFKLTADFGWLVGLFITDENYDKNSGSVWQITQSEGEILTKLIGILDKLDIKYSITDIVNSSCKSLKVYSNAMVDLFHVVFGIRKGNKYKCLPPSILKYNEDFVCGLISGILDGNGYVLSDEYDDFTVNIEVASRSLINQLQLVLEVFGIETYCYMQLSENSQVYTVDNTPIFRMTFKTTEKVVKKICKDSIKLKNKNITKFSVYIEEKTDGTIKNIRDYPIIDENVYDFTTESSHFLVNGVRVHNCGGHSPSYVAKFGLSLPNLSSAAKPAKHADVFLEQLIKFAASMQGHFSGAVGFDAVNMFVAPYLVGLSDEKVKQCAQILVYEFAQQAVARGGQSARGDTPILIRQSDTKHIEIITIGEFCHSFLEGEGKKVFTEDEKKYETLSLNRKTGKLEWKSINGVYVHIPATKLKEVKLGCGRNVIVTEDHSLFTIDVEGNFVESTTRDNSDTYLVAKRFPIDITECQYNAEDAWAIGVMIGDGCVINNNSINLSTSSLDVATRFSDYIKTKFNCKGTIHENKEKHIYSITGGKIAAEYFNVIGHGAFNKKIPVEFFSAPDEIVLSLLDGLLCSDAGVTRNRYEFYTTSEELKNGICFLLTRLGLEYGIRERNSKSNFNRNYPVYTILVSSTSSKLLKTFRKTRKIGPDPEAYSTSPHNFGIMKDKLKKDYGVGISNKAYAFRTNSRKIKYNQLMLLSDKLDYLEKYENIIPMEVKSIEDAPEEEFVYDIGVDDNENFVLANGIIAHNTIFSDLNLYWEIPKHYQNVEAIGPGGVSLGIPYKEFDYESKRFMRAIMQVYAEGDGSGRPFFFPKADCHITADSVDDEEYMNMLGYVASKMGSPYFIFDRGNAPSVSQCCRLKLTLSKTDIDELKTPWVSRFTALQNVTMNLPAFAYQSGGDEGKFNEILYTNMMIAKDAHQQKLNFISHLLDLGEDGPLNLLNMDHDGTPYIRYDKMKFLIGMVGLNEAVQLLCGEELHESKEAYMLGLKIIAQMNANCKDITKELGFTTILEQTPAESTAYRFAKLDLNRYGEPMKKIIKGTIDAPYYTNSTYLNVGANISPIERVKKEGKFHTLIDAGSITHVWLGDHTPDPASVAQFVRKTFYNTSNAQIAFSPEFTACNSCQKLQKGLSDKCEFCGSENVDGITRITGYFSKIQNWNKAKKQELKDRYRVTI